MKKYSNKYWLFQWNNNEMKGGINDLSDTNDSVYELIHSIDINVNHGIIIDIKDNSKQVEINIDKTCFYLIFNDNDNIEYKDINLLDENLLHKIQYQIVEFFYK